jgi:hypothetical protein
MPLYAVAGRRDVTIYRENWQDGKAIGKPQIVLNFLLRFRL